MFVVARGQLRSLLYCMNKFNGKGRLFEPKDESTYNAVLKVAAMNTLFARLTTQPKPANRMARSPPAVVALMRTSSSVP